MVCLCQDAQFLDCVAARVSGGPALASPPTPAKTSSSRETKADLEARPHGAACNPCRQVLALCITSTNTFSGLLAGKGTSIPAFQSLFNYVLLNLIYTTITIYKYGFKKWSALLYKDGWRCKYSGDFQCSLTRYDFCMLTEFM